MLQDVIIEPFPGFEPQALKFLKSLQNKKNNNTEWFSKHRAKYEQYLKEPMKHLIDTLAAEINKIDKDIVVNHKSIFRINKDIRFSKDKRPYKTHYSAAFAFDKIKSSEIPQFYFHFEPNEFLIAGGQYSSEPNNLKKIRNYIIDNFDELEEIISDKEFVKHYKKLEGEKALKLGSEYKQYKDTDLEKYLLMKQYYVETAYKPEVIYDNGVVDIIIKHIKLMHPLVHFLHKATK